MSRIEAVTLKPSPAASVRATLPVAELPAFFAQAFHEMQEAIARAGARCVGPPFARYHSIPPGPIDVEALMPVDQPIATVGRVKPVELGGGPAVQVLHVGPYDDMAPVYDEIARFVAANGLEPADAPREVYLSDPQRVPDPAMWQTLVVQPTRPTRRA